jgi:hypothetical protein
MFERGDLRCARGRLHLLAKTGNLRIPLGYVEFLAAAERLFFDEGLLCRGEGEFGFRAGFLCPGDATRGIGEFFAEPLEFEVLGLENDEMFEIGVHMGRV